MHSWKLRYSIFRVNQSRSMPASCTCCPSIAVAVTIVPPCLKKTKNLDAAYESSRVERTDRVECLLDPLGQGPVCPGPAPDAKPDLPAGGTARQDHAAALGQGAESIDLGGSVVQRPVAQGM